METSLKDLGIQANAMTFEEMMNEKKQRPIAPSVVAPQPQMHLPQFAAPLDPPAVPHVQLPHPAIPHAPFETHPPFLANPKAAPMISIDSYQKEILVLALVATAISTPAAQDKLGELAYLKDSRFLKAAASGALVAVAFALARKFFV